MLTARCFTREWIDAQTRRLAARNPRLVETCLHAFELVGRLAAAGLDFVFKGGTSVLLHLQPFRRLRVPSIDCLLGDKLTAFAPSTIGVLYAPQPRNPGDRQPEPMPIQALKQLFDVGELFMAAHDLAAAAQAYDRVYAVQNAARGGGFSREQCLNDTLDAAFLISQMQLRQEVRNERTAFLNRGIRELDSHILGPAFDMRAAKLQAARVAHLAALLRTGRLDVPLATVRQMPPIAELAALTIASPYDRLAALRQTSPEAFYGWYQASQLLA